MEAPCKNCPDRCVEPNCHMSCPKYIEFQAFRQQLSDKRAVASALNDYDRQIIARIRKKERQYDRCPRYRSRMK